MQYNVFGGLLPVKLVDAHATDTDLQADALGLIDRVLDALSSNAKLEAALDPDGTGVFDHWHDDGNGNGIVDSGESRDFGQYDTTDRRFELFNAVSTAPARTPGNMGGEREQEVIAALGTTSFTRFGFWRRESTTSARRNDGEGANVIRTRGGPGTFAYSPLDKARVGAVQNLGFPSRGSAARKCPPSRPATTVAAINGLTPMAELARNLLDNPPWERSR